MSFDFNYRRQCFFNRFLPIFFFEAGPTEKQKLTFQGKELPLTISYGHRASQQATAQLTKILLEEGLGYDDVKLVPCFQETLGTNCGSAR